MLLVGCQQAYWLKKNDKPNISLLLEITYFNGARLGLKLVPPLFIYFNKREALKKSLKSFLFYPKNFFSLSKDLNLFTCL